MYSPCLYWLCPAVIIWQASRESHVLLTFTITAFTGSIILIGHDELESCYRQRMTNDGERQDETTRLWTRLVLTRDDYKSLFKLRSNSRHGTQLSLAKLKLTTFFENFSLWRSVSSVFSEVGYWLAIVDSTWEEATGSEQYGAPLRVVHLFYGITCPLACYSYYPYTLVRLS